MRDPARVYVIRNRDGLFMNYSESFVKDIKSARTIRRKADAEVYANKHNATAVLRTVLR